jgi:hypothetical protein
MRGALKQNAGFRKRAQIDFGGCWGIAVADFLGLSVLAIPACVHFCWIGPRLPWAYVFAVLSAAERSDMPDIMLHHTDELEDGPQSRALIFAPRVTLVRVAPLDCLARVERVLGLGDGLTALYQRLSSPVMRSDILRVAIVYLQGGIYLDLDTVTVASLRPLLEMPVFVGSEFVVWPQLVYKSRSPLLWARVLVLDLLRKFLRVLPQGWRLFRRFEKFYFRGVNNAIFGAEAGSPFLAAYLQAMVALAPERQTRPYGLGPDLLQEIVDRNHGLTVQEPRVFFPLGPEISEHWFRGMTNAEHRKVLFPETLVVHWYASVRGKSRVSQISPDYVRAHRADQLYAALVCANIRQLPAAE